VQTIDATRPDAVVTAALPFQSRHSWRQWSFGPDGRVYVATATPFDAEPDGNFTYRAGGRSYTFPFGSIIRMDPDGTSPELLAKGEHCRDAAVCGRRHAVLRQLGHLGPTGRPARGLQRKRRVEVG
jgi:hypothetical protein